jgi:hypothetical protein
MTSGIRTRAAQAFTRVSRRVARPRIAGLVAGIVALLAYLLGPPGGDAAAHLYLTQLWHDQGWQLWDNLWYGGRYSQVNYSLVYYPLSALISTPMVVAGSVGVAATAFASVVRRTWPTAATPAVVAFALLLPLGVVAGTYPFLLGLAVALVTLATVLRGRVLVAAPLALVTTLSHPLAMVFLSVALIAVAMSAPGWWRSPRNLVFAGFVVAVVAGQALLLRAFAAEGHYPFDPKDAIAIGGFCAAGLFLTRGLKDQRPMALLFAGYAVLAAGAFTLSSPVGGNVVRLLLLMGVPLLLVPFAARGFRPRSLGATLLLGAFMWQALPAVAGWQAATTARAASEEFWYPAITFLQQHGDPNHRVEVVATSDNWEAYYLAKRGVPLARGWFRQDDFPGNEALYKKLTPARYQAWMRRLGIRYVLVPDDPLDYSARNEADLIRRGAGLDLVAQVGGWTFYELPDATPIVTPRDGATVVSLTSDQVTIRVARPGRYRLSLNYTPYWSIRGGGACASPLKPWGTELQVRQAGLVRLNFDVGLRTFVDTVLGAEGGCASEPTGARLAESIGARPGTNQARRGDR